jgi:hypothetical protein
VVVLELHALHVGS